MSAGHVCIVASVGGTPFGGRAKEKYPTLDMFQAQRRPITAEQIKSPELRGKKVPAKCLGELPVMHPRKLTQVSADIMAELAKCGHTWPTHTKIWKENARPRSAGQWPQSASSSRTLPMFNHMWPSLAQVWQTSALVRVTSNSLPYSASSGPGT